MHERRRKASRPFALLTAALVLAMVAPGNAAQSPQDAFDRIAADALASGRVAGFSMAVVHDGKIVYAKGFGTADVEQHVPVRADTRFAIGSITKQFTAAAIMLLAVRGKISFPHSMEQYFPSWPNMHAITLRMLLNQTSGLHNYPNLSEHPWPLQGPIDVYDLLDILMSDKPDFAPGTKWAYSNTNYTLLGALIPVVSRENEATFLEREIFAPLGMSASGFGFAAQQDPALAKPHDGPAPFTVHAPQTSLDLFAGAGAMVSSAPDLAKWDIALMNGTLFDERVTHDLWMPGKLNDGTPVPYAMGFVPGTLAGHREMWHNGLAPGAGGYCLNAIFPDDKLAVVVLGNTAEFEGVAERIVERVFATYEPDAAAPDTRPTPAPGEDPRVTQRAKDWWNRLATGTVDLHQVYPAFAERLTPQMLAAVQAGIAGQTPTDWIYLGASGADGTTIYRYWIRLNGVPHTWSIAIKEGRIAGSGLQ